MGPEAGRVVRLEDIQSWLTEPRTKADGQAVIDKRARKQVVRIFDTMATVGTVNAKVKKISGVDGTSSDGRQKSIYPVPSTVAPEVAVAADVELRDMRARVHELKRSVSHLNAKPGGGSSVESELKRMTAAGSAEEERTWS